MACDLVRSSAAAAAAATSAAATCRCSASAAVLPAMPARRASSPACTASRDNFGAVRRTEDFLLGLRSLRRLQLVLCRLVRGVRILLGASGRCDRDRIARRNQIDGRGLLVDANRRKAGVVGALRERSHLRLGSFDPLGHVDEHDRRARRGDGKVRLSSDDQRELRAGEGGLEIAAPVRGLQHAEIRRPPVGRDRPEHVRRVRTERPGIRQPLDLGMDLRATLLIFHLHLAFGGRGKGRTAKGRASIPDLRHS